MSKESSFDIVSKVDLSEVDNAINIAMKEIKNRYDFKGSKVTFPWTKAARSSHWFPMMNTKWAAEGRIDQQTDQA